MRPNTAAVSPEIGAVHIALASALTSARELGAPAAGEKAMFATVAVPIVSLEAADLASDDFMSVHRNRPTYRSYWFISSANGSCVGSVVNEVGKPVVREVLWGPYVEDCIAALARAAQMFPGAEQRILEVRALQLWCVWSYLPETQEDRFMTIVKRQDLPDELSSTDLTRLAARVQPVAD